jgi:hypothetical protein
MIDLIFVLLLFTGCGCWLTGVVSVLTGDGLTPMNLFLILVGGQLARLGWTDVLVQGITRRHSELMRAIKDRLKW